MSKFHVAGVLCYASEDGDELVLCVETIVEAVDSDSALWLAANQLAGVDLDDPAQHAYFDEKYNELVVEEVPDDSYLLDIRDELELIQAQIEADLPLTALDGINRLLKLIPAGTTFLVKPEHKDAADDNN
jgi:hypothetical protein